MTSTIESGLTNYDGLIAGGSPITDDSATLLSGQTVVRGQAIGQVTASGKWKAFNSGNSDGSQSVVAVALEDVDASAADKPIAIALAGEINGAKMTFANGADTAANKKALFRTFSLYIKTNQRSVAK